MFKCTLWVVLFSAASLIIVFFLIFIIVISVKNGKKFKEVLMETFMCCEKPKSIQRSLNENEVISIMNDKLPDYLETPMFLHFDPKKSFNLFMTSTKNHEKTFFKFFHDSFIVDGTNKALTRDIDGSVYISDYDENNPFQKWKFLNGVISDIEGNMILSVNYKETHREKIIIPEMIPKKFLHEMEQNWKFVKKDKKES